LVKRIPRSVYPNIVTIINLFCGFYSILLASNQQYMMAFWAIIAGAIADAFDGKVARIVKGTSEFGVQYDSLADLITFAAAPSFLVYQLFNSNDALFIATSFFPLLFGSLRLARFNIELEGFDKTEFNGLPSPAAAISIVSIIPFNIAINREGWINQDIWIEYPELGIISVAYFSLLMVSKIKYETLPDFTLRSGRENAIKLVALAVFIPFLVTEPYLVLFPAALIFSLLGIIRWIYNKNKKLGGDTADEKHN